MPFPPTTRVIYRNNPLVEVVCQLRFPAILEIDTTSPAEFQRALRSEFPLMMEASEVRLEMPGQPREAEAGPGFVIGALQPLGGRNWQFSSRDGSWTVTLARGFLALRTTAYVRWEDFCERLRGPLDALIQTYEPSFFTRIGLRYIDVINRARLGIPETPWSNLVTPPFTGLLGSSLADSVRGFESMHEVALEDGGGTARIVAKLVVENATSEQCFMIDGDYFDHRETEIAEAWARLDFLHHRASRLLSWATSEPLREALHPEELE